MMEKSCIAVVGDLGLPCAAFAKIVRAVGLPHIVVLDRELTKADAALVDVVVVAYGGVGPELLRRFPAVKLIALAYTGFDNVDGTECRAKGVRVCNLPGYSSRSVAELTVGLAISLLRHIRDADAATRRGQWGGRLGRELGNCVIGVVGTGKIGITASRLFRAFGCEILGWSRCANATFEALGGKYCVDRMELFSQADIVTLHLPLKEDTCGIVGANELSAMKPSALLINTARGAIMDETALIDALRRGGIAGAALDVYVDEPIGLGNPLLKMENVLLTPHMGFKTAEAMRRRAEITANSIARFVSGRPVNVVV